MFDTKRDVGFIERHFGTARIQLRQRICALTGGHDMLRHYEKDRLSLQCTSCGHETPGWDLRATANIPAIATVARIVRIPLIQERPRKVA